MNGNQNRIRVITDTTTKTGLGKYAYYVSLALSTELISLRKDNKKKVTDYGGKIFNGFTTGGVTSGYYLNEKFPGFAFRKCASYIKKDSDSNTVVHYTNPGIRKFSLNAKELVTFHDLFPLKNTTNNRVDKIKVKNFLSYMDSSNALTISNVVKKDLKTFGYEGNIQVIYHPVSQNFFKIEEPKESIRKRLHLPLNKKLILSVSTASVNKNLDVVEKTLKLLGENYNLVRVGPALPGSITFTNVSEDELNMIYNACDVLLIPSSSEGFGFPVIEAFATGLPVVASDIEIFKEITKGSAILSKIEPTELSHSISKAIDQTDKYSTSGLEIAKYYSFEKFRSNMRNYYSRTFGISFNDC